MRRGHDGAGFPESRCDRAGAGDSDSAVVARRSRLASRPANVRHRPAPPTAFPGTGAAPGLLARISVFSILHPASAEGNTPDARALSPQHGILAFILPGDSAARNLAVCTGTSTGALGAAEPSMAVCAPRRRVARKRSVRPAARRGRRGSTSRHHPVSRRRGELVARSTRPVETVKQKECRDARFWSFLTLAFELRHIFRLRKTERRRRHERIARTRLMCSFFMALTLFGLIRNPGPGAVRESCDQGGGHRSKDEPLLLEPGSCTVMTLSRQFPHFS